MVIGNTLKAPVKREQKAYWSRFWISRKRFKNSALFFHEIL